MTTDSIDVPFSPLVAEIVTAAYQQTAWVTSQLIETLQRQLAWADAREKAVEDGINRLFAGPWMPMPGAVLSALYPSKAQIERFLDGAR